MLNGQELLQQTKQTKNFVISKESKVNATTYSTNYSGLLKPAWTPVQRWIHVSTPQTSSDQRYTAQLSYNYFSQQPWPVAYTPVDPKRAYPLCVSFRSKLAPYERLFEILFQLFPCRVSDRNRFLLAAHDVPKFQNYNNKKKLLFKLLLMP